MTRAAMTDVVEGVAQGVRDVAEGRTSTKEEIAEAVDVSTER